MTPTASDPRELVEGLRNILGARVTEAMAERVHHSRDEGHHKPQLPDFVAYPLTTDEVSRILMLCNDRRFPVVAWDAGKSLEGNALAVCGGVCLDLSRMNAVKDLHTEDMFVTVEAGVRRSQLNNALKGTGSFFPVDPGTNATLGGMAATRASGATAFRYGTMRANVRACTAVFADGTIVRTVARAPKTAAGCDLTGLLVGSEGTLGVITELDDTLFWNPLSCCRVHSGCRGKRFRLSSALCNPVAISRASGTAMVR